MSGRHARFAAEAGIPANAEDADGPVFREPSEAQAFAMTVALHQAGLFSWSEWTATLSAEIAAAAQGGDESDDPYYRRWLAALERLVVEKGVVARDDLVQRQAAWDRAARATPHGRPIVIESDPDRAKAFAGGGEQTWR